MIRSNETLPEKLQHLKNSFYKESINLLWVINQVMKAVKESINIEHSSINPLDTLETANDKFYSITKSYIHP